MEIQLLSKSHALSKDLQNQGRPLIRSSPLSAIKNFLDILFLLGCLMEKRDGNYL